MYRVPGSHLRIGCGHGQVIKIVKMIQDALWENVLMHLCRLVDSRSTFGKENLTIRRLPELVSDPLKMEVEQAISDVLKSCDFAKDWRNRRISHSDLDLSTGASSQPLAVASRAKVREALKGLCKVLNLVEGHYTNSAVMYDFIEPRRGSKLMLHVLKSGIKAEAARRKRLMNGCPETDDFE
jgi:hypothetical protein